MAKEAYFFCCYRKKAVATKEAGLKITKRLERWLMALIICLLLYLFSSQEEPSI